MRRRDATITIASDGYIQSANETGALDSMDSDRWRTRPRKDVKRNTKDRQPSHIVESGRHRMKFRPIKRLLLVLSTLIGGGAVLLCLPLTSVAVLTITVLDQDNQKMTANATATFLDHYGKSIVKITSKTPGSWDNNLHWWTHSSHSTSKLRPADAMRAASVLIQASDCEAATLPIKLQRSYQPMSIAPHGGGAAYFIYKFDRTIVLQCR